MLSGIRIVEVEGIGPGPFAGMHLADLGADVIVIHRKQPTDTPGPTDRSIINRGKRSIALDLKDIDDLETFKKLVSTADGLIEGFRPGVMERLGIGPEECHAINPALVYGRMTGWGQDGPLSKVAGHDLNYISISGAGWYASPAGETPFTPPTVIGDIGGGSLYLAVGLLSGILQARQSGEGTIVDASIVDGSAHMMNLLMAMRQAGLFEDKRGENLLDGPHWSRSYRTADDGFISVQCLEAKFYTIFIEKLDLADDEDFKQQHNKALWPLLNGRLEDLFRTRSRDDWAKLFEGSDACVAPVLSPGEALNHPNNRARQVWVEADGVLQAAAAPRFSTIEQWQPRSSPTRGEHTKAILAELNNSSN